MSKLKKTIGLFVILCSLFVLNSQVNAASHTGGGFMMVEPNGGTPQPETEPSEPQINQPQNNEKPNKPDKEGHLPQTGETKSSLLLVIGSLILTLTAIIFTLNKKNKKNRSN